MNFVPFKEMIIEITFTDSTIIASRARKLSFNRITSVLQEVFCQSWFPGEILFKLVALKRLFESRGASYYDQKVSDSIRLYDCRAQTLGWFILGFIVAQESRTTRLIILIGIWKRERPINMTMIWMYWNNKRITRWILWGRWADMIERRVLTQYFIIRVGFLLRNGNIRKYNYI